MNIAITPGSLWKSCLYFFSLLFYHQPKVRQGIASPSLALIPPGTKGGRGPLAVTAQSGATAAPSCLGDCSPSLPLQAQPIVPRQQWCLEPCRSCPPSKAAAMGVLVLQPGAGTLPSVKGKGKRETPRFPKAQPAFSGLAVQHKSFLAGTC